MSQPAGALFTSATSTPAALASSVSVTGLPWASSRIAVRIKFLPVLWSGPSSVSAMAVAKRPTDVSRSILD
jgi:hypothetical protein